MKICRGSRLFSMFSKQRRKRARGAAGAVVEAVVVKNLDEALFAQAVAIKFWVVVGAKKVEGGLSRGGVSFFGW